MSGLKSSLIIPKSHNWLNFFSSLLASTHIKLTLFSTKLAPARHHPVTGHDLVQSWQGTCS